jgi:branched-chain amino acid transport system ATP-binding protein
MGGVGRPWGPVIGGMIYFVVQYFVPTPEIQLMLAGVSILGVVFVFPDGILGQLEKIPVFRSIANNASELPPLSQERISELLVNTDEVAIVLEGREISHDFGGLRAVNKVSFSVLRGEIVGLLGPNGAGKSTLFDCISGILKPTSGEIFLNGQDITRLSTWKVNHYGLARTFEQTRLFDGLTVYENMLLARKWRNVPLSIWILGEPKAVRQRANDLLTLLGIGHIRQQLARDLSTSEQRLLEIAMALMSEPSIILLDEIAAGIPLSTANELKTTLRRLNRDFGLTFFIVEHNMSFAVDLCDRVYVLDHGSIVAAGMPQDMLREPAVADAYYGHE